MARIGRWRRSWVGHTAATAAAANPVKAGGEAFTDGTTAAPTATATAIARRIVSIRATP